MMSKKLRNDANLSTSSEVGEYIISDYGYGKDNVKLLHVVRNGPVHSIKELEVCSHLKLYDKKDYLYGDNSDIVATDSQKNTIYLLAKKYGVKSPEDYALLLCAHFLSKYSHVKEVSIQVVEYPWKRIGSGDGPFKKLHNHAFMFSPTSTRYCTVTHARTDPVPTVISGIKDLRVLKTTQSSFVNFIDDEYRSLPDMKDRIFSTIVRSSWQYSSWKNLDFDKIHNRVMEIILKNFAGDADKGIMSPSVQNTLYVAEKEVLDVIPEISTIDMEMPNKHYFTVDLSKFPKVVQGENEEVFLPVDKPSGIIYAQLDRRDIMSKL
ncbi:uricase [Phlebotomus argentipes]|uniref:uricase n=1 Tax=Phlebotomus argentipes TaxID=94469 RepID=UPI002892AFAD|nr:uricase [Phlebotomus argentipes]